MKKQKNKRRKHRNMEYLSRFPVPNYAAGRKQDTRICYDRRSVCRPRNQNSRGR